METKVIIKHGKQSDRQYDKLFARLDAASAFGRAQALREENTAEGYVVVLASLPDEVREWIGGQKGIELA